MTTEPSRASGAHGERSAADRTADLVLRGPTRPLLARARWPRDRRPGGGRPALLVHLGDAGDADAWDGAGGGGGQAGMVVLCLDPASCGVEETLAVVRWAADHATELGADGSCVLVGGTGPGADVARAVAEHARAEEWPPVQVVGDRRGRAS